MSFLSLSLHDLRSGIVLRIAVHLSVLKPPHIAVCGCDYKHHDRKQSGVGRGEEKVYFSLYFHVAIHHWGRAGQ